MHVFDRVICCRISTRQYYFSTDIHAHSSSYPILIVVTTYLFLSGESLRYTPFGILNTGFPIVFRYWTDKSPTVPANSNVIWNCWQFECIAQHAVALEWSHWIWSRWMWRVIPGSQLCVHTSDLDFRVIHISVCVTCILSSSVGIVRLNLVPEADLIQPVICLSLYISQSKFTKSAKDLFHWTFHLFSTLRNIIIEVNVCECI